MTYTLDLLHAEVQALERLLADSQGSLTPEVPSALRALLDEMYRLLDALLAVVKDMAAGADSEDNAELAAFYWQSISEMVDVLRRWRLELEEPPGRLS